MNSLESKLAQLEQQLKSASDEWVRLDAARSLLLKQLEEKEQSLAQFIDTQDVYEKVRILLQQSADYAREQAKEQIETLVTNALQYIFGPLFQFQIEIEEHGSRSVAEFYVITDYEGVKIKTKPQEARGGGVVDIVTLALRVAIIETVQPKVNGPLLLDEPGKHVSGEYIYYLYEFLKSLSSMFQRQILMVTHNQHLSESGDAAFTVEMRDGISYVHKNDNT